MKFLQGFRRTPMHKRRTAVLCSDSDRILFYAHREHAVRLLAAGAVTAEGLSLRITGTMATADVRAGSYGIRRQHVPVGNQYGLSGGIVFSHKRTYAEVA